MTTKVVIYARVSSVGQEKDGFSIPAQLELLRDYALKNNFTIVKEFEDIETAKKAGRTNYNKMLDFIKASKDISIILVEKTDRLYRNFKDYVMLEDYNLEIHLVKEGGIISKNSNSQAKFMHGIKVLMAKNFIDNLSEEVKKGLTQKAKEGYVTGKQPFGYNKINKRECVIDEKTSLLVKRAFELYSNGDISLTKLSEQLYAEGFIYKDTKPKMQKSQLEHILKNPFYYGMIQFNGELYHGKHEPLIKKDIFDLTQSAFRKDNKPKYTIPKNFLLAGMVKCYHCGCVISGEIKKGKYIYYSCTGAKGKCEQKHIYVKESEIEKQYIEALDRISTSEEQKKWITEALLSSFKDEQAYTKERLNSLNTQKDKLRDRLEAVYVDKLDGKISEAFWLTKHNEWTEELRTIQNNITAHENANINFIEKGMKILKLSNEVKELYLYGDNAQKKELLNYVLQNSTLDGEKLSYEYKAPFDLFANGLSRIKKLPRLDSNQQPTG